MMFDRQWNSPSASMSLSTDQVHLWRAWLDLPPASVHRLEHSLSTDERKRAERFRFDRDRRRFIVCRSVLRVILSRYLDMDPCLVELCDGNRGKPQLANAEIARGLQFNLTHSYELALYVVGRARQVGIDLEYLRSLPDIQQVVSHFFSKDEQECWASLSRNQQLEAFYRYWTSKEAYLKATGQGLAIPLDGQEACKFPRKYTGTSQVERHQCENGRWCLMTLMPAPGYIAALAVEGAGWYCVFWQDKSESAGRLGR